MTSTTAPTTSATAVSASAGVRSLAPRSTSRARSFGASSTTRCVPRSPPFNRCRFAAQAGGGDWRGHCSARILVVPPEGEPWDRVVDLRVEESETPLADLRRLVERALGYRRWNRADSGRAKLAAA